MNDAVIFYRSFYEAVKDLPPSDYKEAVNAMLGYDMDGTEPDAFESKVAQIVYTMAKPQIDANNKRYENGCKGGRPKKENQKKTKPKPNDNQTETEPKPNDNDNVNDNVNVNDNENVNENDNDNDNVNVNDIIRSWNDLIGVGITPIKSIGHTRKSHLRARLREYGSESIYDIIDRIRESDFLQGKHKGKPWVCTFDWVILPNNYPKVLEGNYANKSVTKEDKISDIDEYIARRAGVIT
jgi:hypothetical protein